MPTFFTFLLYLEKTDERHVKNQVKVQKTIQKSKYPALFIHIIPTIPIFPFILFAKKISCLPLYSTSLASWNTGDMF